MKSSKVILTSVGAALVLSASASAAFLTSEEFVSRSTGGTGASELLFDQATTLTFNQFDASAIPGSTYIRTIITVYDDGITANSGVTGTNTLTNNEAFNVSAATEIAAIIYLSESSGYDDNGTDLGFPSSTVTQILDSSRTPGSPLLTNIPAGGDISTSFSNPITSNSSFDTTNGTQGSGTFDLFAMYDNQFLTTTSGGQTFDLTNDGSFTGSITVGIQHEYDLSVIPEPSAFGAASVAFGLAGLIFARRRRECRN